MVKKKDNVSLTYIGCFVNPDPTTTHVLDELMRKFQSGKRFLRERIFEGYNRKEAVDHAKPLFLYNSRYMRDAFLEAEASISSQKELLPLYIQQHESSIQKLEKQIQKLKLSNRWNKEQRIAYKQSKIKKLRKERNYYQYHISNGTVPKMVDGTIKKMELVKKGKITKEEWREARSNALYSRGEKSKGGNENMSLSHQKDNFFKVAILNPLSSKKGDRLHFVVRFPEKFVLTIATYLETKEAYSIRIKRRNEKYEVHLTLEEENVTEPSVEYGVAGMDINPDNLSVTIIYPNGNFRSSKVFWMHEINTVSSNKRNWIIQQTLYKVMEWVKSFHIDTLVIEKLKFLQQNGTKRFNRMSHNFSFSSIMKSLISIAYKKEIALVQVDAYYSSFIGKVKYQQTYGLSVHQSAAYVLARRGMSFTENVPKSILLVLFTKEVKKGQSVSNLFKHWKKVKEWYDESVSEIRMFGIPSKGLHFNKILDKKNQLLPF